MTTMLHKITAPLFVFFAAVQVSASDRFPRPEFQSGYEIPPNDFGVARHIALYYLDVFVLFLALCAATYFVFKKRSRIGVFCVMLFSICYFGFFKRGCVCSIGAIQNVTAGLFSNYTISITLFLIFVLPILFSLFFGKVFCSGVCPMGALQDLVAFKAKPIPKKISAVLQFIPHVYLGITILFAATGAGFPVCKLDPFAGIFRLGAPLGMTLWGVSIIAIGIFIARPYCRFLCPYGLLLSWTSSISKYRVKICKDQCVNCRLCENVCPVDAISAPTTEPIKEKRARSINRLKLYCALLPLWIAGFALCGYLLSDFVSPLHPDVKLYNIIMRDENSGGAHSLESEALRADLFISKTANVAKYNLLVGMTILGAYLGLVLGASFIRRSIHKKRETYEADPSACVACARCYKYCPKQGTQIK